MARTLIGQLILKLQDDVSAKAKKAAEALKGVDRAAKSLGKGTQGTDKLAKSLDNLNEKAKRLASAPWGHQFQARLEKLGASAKEIDKLRHSWQQLQQEIASGGLNKALQKSHVAAWKTATLSSLAQVRTSLRQTQVQANTMGRAMFNAMKPFYAAVGLGTGAYVPGRLGAAFAGASSEREREKFRQQMSGLSPAEQLALRAKSIDLSGKYRSVDATQIMELGRSAMPFMGTPDRGLSVLEQMTKALVVLQASKGEDAAVAEITGLIRGIDNLGKNDAGQLGIDNVKQIINGVVRAVQIEGRDFDARKLFDFAKRAKIAGPGLSTDFIMSTAPALMQDMTPEGFGTAISSAYQSYVIGSNAVASKSNIAEQRRLGLRTGEGKGELVDAGLFGRDPYAWTKKHLIPALQKDGVNMSDETAIAQAIAKTSRNTMATGMLTRLVTQQAQIDQLLGAYQKAQGVDAAGEASSKNPFQSWEGLLASLRNLSATVGEAIMPIIVPGLNALTDGINAISSALGTLPGWMTAGIALGATGGGLLGLFKGGKFLMSMLSLGAAGPALLESAAALNVAAAALGGAGAAGAAGGGIAGKASWLSRVGKWAGRFGLLGAGAWAGYEAVDYLRNSGGGPKVERKPFQYRNGIPSSLVQDGAMDQAKRKADQARQSIEGLNVQVNPQVSTESLDSAIAKAARLNDLLNALGPKFMSVRDRQDRVLLPAYSDYGVAP